MTRTYTGLVVLDLVMMNTSYLKSEFVHLNDGRKMPIVGLGTFQGNFDFKVDYDDVVSSVKSALKMGYRHIDTAYNYNTEKGVGEAVRQTIQEQIILREDLFVVTKLWNTFHRKELVVPALKESLSHLGLDYVDMYLIHTPVSFVPSDDLFPKNEDGEFMFDDDQTDITETWQGMEECVKQGLAKSIGVSNFNINQLKRIIASCSIKPATNQLEVHPFRSNVESVDFCNDHGIVVVGYCPIGMPYRPWAKEDDPSIFTDPTLKKIGDKYKKSGAQVALRFQIQRGIVVIPKSTSPVHQRENSDIFDFSLSDEEMKSIHKCNKDFFACAPFFQAFSASKECPFK